MMLGLCCSASGVPVTEESDVLREGSQALHVAVGKHSACYKALLHLALCWVLTMMFFYFHLFLLLYSFLISVCIWLSFQKQTKNKPSGSLFSLYQPCACWFDIFLWKQYIIFDTSTTSCCLGEICCASFYHWKLSFPPCSGGNFLLKAFSMSCAARDGLCRLSCFVHPKTCSHLLWFCTVTNLFLSVSEVSLLTAFCFTISSVIPALYDAHHFLLISLSFSQEDERQTVSLISLKWGDLCISRPPVI